MRLLAFFAFAFPAFAAPIPKTEKPPLDITLNAKNPLVLTITIHNHGKDDLKIPYRITPLEHITVTMRGELGKEYTIAWGDSEDEGKPGTLTIEPGKSHKFTIHTCHYLPELGEPGQKVTFGAKWNVGRATLNAEPLTVGHGKEDDGPIRKLAE